MFPVLISVAGFPIHAYGVLIAFGFLMCLWFCKSDAIRLGINPDLIVDIGFWSLLVGMIGCRILYVITRWHDIYSQHPIEILYIWEGGLVFWAGPLACIPFYFWYCKRHGLNVLEVLDIGAVAVPIAHFFGRIGCLSAGCCYGKVTNLPWGIELHSELVDPILWGKKLHPTQIYEAIGLLFIFLILFNLRKKKKFKGEIALSYLILYSILRSIVEIFRGDLIRGFVIDKYLSTSQFISLIVIVVALALYFRQRKKIVATVITMVTVCFMATASSADVLTKDFRNQTIDFKANPQKIVVLIPSLAEALYDLGVGDRIVGVPAYTSIPNLFKNKVKIIGGYHQLSAEYIYSLKPDLIIANFDGNQQQVVEKLESLKIKTIVFNSENLKQIIDSLETLATMFNQAQNQALVQLKAFAASNTPASATSKKLFFQLGINPLVSVNKTTFIGEIIEKLGFKNILAESNIKYPRPNVEAVIKENPDYIIICELVENNDQALKAKNFWAQFKNLNAIKNQKIFIMPIDWITKPGFNLIRGIQYLKGLLNKS